MASAEKLLHEAQYAFASITFADSPGNARNRARARSLCKKILRKYPGTMEAAEAVAILQRMGEVAYVSSIRPRHQHATQNEGQGKSASTMLAENRTFITQDAGQDASLNWSGLLSVLLAAPKFVLGILGVFGLILFGILGPLLFVPFVIAFLVLGPFKSILNQRQREQVDSFIVAVNQWIDADGKTSNWIGRG